MRQIVVFFLSVAIILTIVSCESGVEKRLESIEQMMDEHPDTALNMLKAIEYTQISTKLEMAKYALLMTKARDKNYFFETNDSLINKAIAYFDDKEYLNYRTQSHFYKASIYFNRKDYKNAMNESLIALECVAKDDCYMLAKIYELISDIYYYSYNMDKTIYYKKIAHDYNLESGRTLNAWYAITDIALAYDINKERNRAIQILDSIAENYEGKDSTFLGYLNNSYLRPLIALGASAKALEKHNNARAYWADRADYLQEMSTVANMFLACGIKDSALLYFEKEKVVNTNWKNDENYHLGLINYYKSTGDFEKALNEYDVMNKIHNAKLRETLKNDVESTVSDYYKTKSLVEKIKAEKYIIILSALGSILVVVAISFFMFYKIRMKHKKQEIEDMMCESQALLVQLTDQSQHINTLNEKQSELRNKVYMLETDVQKTQKGLVKQRALIEQLFKERFESMDLLCSEYFQKKDFIRVKATVIKDFEREIERLKHPESMKRLEDIVNQCCDNILIRIQEQFPKFKDSDITLLALRLAGFSARSVCLFTGLTVGNFYNKWTRLRGRIDASNAPDKNFFLALLK